MGVVEQTIELDVPVAAAYKQFARFEEFPRFMDGVVSIERLADDRVRWQASICGNDAEWYARIAENVPNERIAWQSEGGLINAGLVTLEKIGATRTRVHLRIEYDPDAVLKAIGYKLIAGTEQVHRDLECFKEIVEDIAEEATLATKL